MIPVNRITFFPAIWQASTRLVAASVELARTEVSNILSRTASQDANNGILSRSVALFRPLCGRITGPGGCSLETKQTKPSAVGLIPVSEDLLETYAEWMNSEEFRRYHPNSQPSLAELREQLQAGQFDSTQAGGMFLIQLEGKRPIGWVRYHRPDKAFDSYELGIYIADPKDRGHRVGGAAIGQLIDYLFKNYETVRIQARVLDENPRALSLVRQLGFREEGILRAAFRLGDSHVDVHMFSVLKNEWKSGSSGRPT